MSNRRSRRDGTSRRPVLAFYDDLPALAPDPALPKVLAQSGGQNLIIADTHHDEAQFRAVWGQEGDNMATTIGEQVVFRGVRDERTLQRLSTQTGQHFVEVRSHNTGRTSSTNFFSQGPSKSWGETVTPQLLPVLTPAEINQGHPDDPNIVQCFHTSSWEWAYSTPYYRFPMWVRALVLNMDYVAGLPPQRVHLLMSPELNRGGDVTNLAAAGGKELIDTYFQAAGTIHHKAERYREMQAAWAAEPLMANYDDSRSPQLVEPVVLHAALAEGAEQADLGSVLQALGSWTRVPDGDAGVTWAVTVPEVEPIVVGFVDRGSIDPTDPAW